MTLINVISLLCVFSVISARIINSDPSGLVSVSYVEGQWNIINELLDWNQNENIVARCCFS